MELNDWSDISKFDNMDTIILDEEVEFDQDNNDINDEQPNEQQEETENQSKAQETEQPKGNTGGYQNQKNQNNQNFGEIKDWNDLRIFDDDHDDDWFKVQEKKLAKQYGGNFIRVKYADHGRVVYFCELCVAECNAKKSLELHCHGMKHLKKKDLWEKEGRPPPQIGLKNTNTEPPKSSNSNKWNQPSTKSKKERDFGRKRSRSRSRDRFKDVRQRLSHHGPSRSRSPFRERSWDRDRSRDKSRDFGSFSRSRMDEDPWPLATSRYPYSGSNRGGRSPVHRSFSPPPRPRDFMVTDSFSSRSMTEREKRYPSPPSRVHSFGSRADDTPMPPSPPQFNSADLDSGKSGLATNPAGTLVQKLADCCVKTTEDAELAINVVASLCKSLKEYSHRIGESKIAELVMDAELKIGTVKALKVGMKILNSFGETNKSSTESQTLDFLTSLTGNHGDRSMIGNPGDRNQPPPMSGMFPSTSGRNFNDAPITYPVNPYLNHPKPMNNPPHPFGNNFNNQRM